MSILGPLTGVISGALRQSFENLYENSPVTLVGGIAAGMSGGSLPISQLLNTPSAGFLTNLIGGSAVSALSQSGIIPDTAFAKFKPMPGGSLIENDVGTYPFANQQVAANAIIVNPLRISMIMQCPAQGVGGWSNKAQIMRSLQTTIALHNVSGGTYTVATPSYTYANCLLLALKDVSDSSSEQPQWRWQWDFIQPIITTQQAQQAQNALMSKATAGNQILPNANGVIPWSGQGSIAA